MKNLRLFLWCCVAIAVGISGGLLYVNSTREPAKSSVRTVAEIGGPFELVDHNGTPVTQAILDGSPSLLFFGFTHCPEICPTTLSEVSDWFDELGDSAKNVKAYFITVDPERDDPEVMKDYVTAFSDRIVGLTGSRAEIDRILKNYRIFSRKVRLGDGDYTMDHSASVILLDNHAKFVSTIAYGEDKAVALKKIKKLASNPLS